MGKGEDRLFWSCKVTFVEGEMWVHAKRPSLPRVMAVLFIRHREKLVNNSYTSSGSLQSKNGPFKNGDIIALSFIM